MFTIPQIKAIHAKVKSGADFPKYVQELIQLGVERYESFVTDGHIMYYGKNGFNIQSAVTYTTLNISDQSDINQFQQDLKAHQQGKTNYPTFCQDCAASGIEKWIVDMEKMTCTYYDKKGNEILREVIPVV